MAAITAGSININLTSDNNRFKQGVNEAGDKLNELQNHGNNTGNKFMDMGRIAEYAIGGLVAGAFQTAMGSIQGVVSGSVQAAAQFEAAMTTLEIVAPRMGANAEQAKELANRLGKDLRIGAGTASDALQNILKSFKGTELEGNLGAAEDMLRRFTNEAITGKSPTISLGQAVGNLAFAFQTSNSALGDMSGIAENWSNIEENGAKIMGKKLSAMTDGERVMARYKGLMELTNQTLGSAEKFEGKYLDKMALRDYALEQLQITMGQRLMPLFAAFGDAQATVFSSIGAVIEDNKGQIDEFFASLINYAGAAREMVVAFFEEVKQPVMAIFDLLKTGDFRGGIFGLEEDHPFIVFLLESRRRAFEFYQIFKEIWDKAPTQIMNFVDGAGKAMVEFWNGPLGQAVQKFASDYWDNLMKNLDLFRTVMWPQLQEVFNAFAKIWTENIGPALMDAWNNFLQPAFVQIVEGANKLYNTFTELWRFLAPVLVPILTFLAAVVGGVLLAVIVVLIGALYILGYVFNFLASVVQWVVNVMISTWNLFVAQIMWVGEVLGQIVAAIQSFVDSVMASIMAVWDWLLDKALWVLDFMNASAEQKAYMIGQFFGQAARFIIDRIIEAGNWVMAKFAEIVAYTQALPGAFMMIFESVKMTIITKIIEAGTWVMAKFGEIVAYTQSLPGAFMAIFESVKSAITGKIQEGIDNIKSTFDTLRNINLLEVGRQIIQGLIDGIVGKGGELASTITNMANNAVQGFKDGFAIHSPSRRMQDEIAGPVMEGFNVGVEDRLPDLRSTLMGGVDMALSAAGMSAQVLAPSSSDTRTNHWNFNGMDLSAIRQIIRNELEATTTKSGEMASQGVGASYGY